MKGVFLKIFNLPNVPLIVFLSFIIAIFSTASPLFSPILVHGAITGDVYPFLYFLIFGMFYVTFSSILYYYLDIGPAKGRIEAVKRSNDPGMHTLNDVDVLYVTAAHDSKDIITFIISVPVYIYTLFTYNSVLGFGALVGVLITFIGAYIRSNKINSFQVTRRNMLNTLKVALGDKSDFIYWCELRLIFLKYSTFEINRGWLITDYLYKIAIFTSLVYWIQHFEISAPAIVGVLAINYALDAVLDSVVPTMASIQRSLIALKHS